MKKIMPILAMLIIVPFVLCSCFAKQVESMSLSYEELELHVGDTKHISVTIKPDGVKTAVAFVSEHGKGQIKLFDKFSVKLIRHF